MENDQLEAKGLSSNHKIPKKQPSLKPNKLTENVNKTGTFFSP